MPISAIGADTPHLSAARPRRDAGFSLVEAMVALMIIGLMTGAVMLLMPGRDGAARAAVERFATRVAYASDASIMLNRPVALVVRPEGYGFARLEEDGWFNLEHGGALAFRAWPDDIDYRIEQPAADEIVDGRVARFDALGGATPASIVLSGGGARWRVRIDGQGLAHVARAD